MHMHVHIYMHTYINRIEKYNINNSISVNKKFQRKNERIKICNEYYRHQQTYFSPIYFYFIENPYT